jgi:hypothetical protein
MPPAFKFDDPKLITKDASTDPVVKTRSPEEQSLGTIVSLVVIVLMIVVGALYAWGDRIAEREANQAKAEATQY